MRSAWKPNTIRTRVPAIAHKFTIVLARSDRNSQTRMRSAWKPNTIWTRAPENALTLDLSMLMWQHKIKWCLQIRQCQCEVVCTALALCLQGGPHWLNWVHTSLKKHETYVFYVMFVCTALALCPQGGPHGLNWVHMSWKKHGMYYLFSCCFSALPVTCTYKHTRMVNLPWCSVVDVCILRYQRIGLRYSYCTSVMCTANTLDCCIHIHAILHVCNSS